MVILTVARRLRCALRSRESGRERCSKADCRSVPSSKADRLLGRDATGSRTIVRTNIGFLLLFPTETMPPRGRVYA